MFEELEGKTGFIVFSDETKQTIGHILVPYWKDRDYLTAFVNILPEDTRYVLYGADPKNTTHQMGLIKIRGHALVVQLRAGLRSLVARASGPTRRPAWRSSPIPMSARSARA